MHVTALGLTAALFPIGAQVKSAIRTDPAMAEVAGLVAVVGWVGLVVLAHRAGSWLLTRHRLAQWGEEWDRLGPRCASYPRPRPRGGGTTLTRRLDSFARTTRSARTSNVRSSATTSATSGTT